MYCFSPVAGILFFESLELNQAIAALEKGFSPVAGILFVESQQVFMVLKILAGVSVPLPGFYLFKAAAGIAASSPVN